MRNTIDQLLSSYSFFSFCTGRTEPTMLQGYSIPEQRECNDMKDIQVRIFNLSAIHIHTYINATVMTNVNECIICTGFFSTPTKVKKISLFFGNTNLTTKYVAYQFITVKNMLKYLIRSN